MLGKRLTELRKARKLTQNEIASKLHIHRSTYAQYEVGRRIPEYGTLEKLANYFDVSIDYLVGRSDEKNAVNKEETEKHPGEILREYMEQGLTNEQIKQRGDLYVAFLALNDEQADEFLEFARNQIFKNLKQPSAAASKSKER